MLTPTNSHVGLAFSPDGQKLYAAGGRDDVVRVYSLTAGTWAASGSIALNHANVGLGVGVNPNAGGLAVSKDGKTLAYTVGSKKEESNGAYAVVPGFAYLSPLGPGTAIAVTVIVPRT